MLASSRTAGPTSSRCCTTTPPTVPTASICTEACPAARWQHLASGVPVCATVTQLDGLVYSRDAKYHSANYRCVMCFGRGRLLEDEAEKRAMFEAMTSRYFPGRTAGRDYTPASAAAPRYHRRHRSADRRAHRQDARGRPQGPERRSRRRAWQPRSGELPAERRKRRISRVLNCHFPSRASDSLWDPCQRYSRLNQLGSYLLP